MTALRLDWMSLVVGGSGCAAPVRLPIQGATARTSGYQRARYRDFTSNLGGPIVHPTARTRLSLGRRRTLHSVQLGKGVQLEYT